MSARTVAEARHESDHLPVLAELSVPDRAFADAP
jgi:endonuclease/exonuclease/phosphatase family metal-dependent hydrolase